MKNFFSGWAFAMGLCWWLKPEKKLSGFYWAGFFLATVDKGRDKKDKRLIFLGYEGIEYNENHCRFFLKSQVLQTLSLMLVGIQILVILYLSELLIESLLPNTSDLLWFIVLKYIQVSK